MALKDDTSRDWYNDTINQISKEPKEQPFNIRDQVKISSNGVKEYWKQIPDHLKKAKHNIKLFKNLSQLQNSNTIGIVRDVFSSGIKVDFDGNIVNLPFSIFEKIKKELNEMFKEKREKLFEANMKKLNKIIMKEEKNDDETKTKELIDKAVEEGYNKEEFKKGLEVESEHTNDLEERAKIAKVHLDEDPKYYTKLTKAGL